MLLDHFKFELEYIINSIKYTLICLERCTDEFKCRNGNTVSKSLRCDEGWDCDDGSDESEYCGKLSSGVLVITHCANLLKICININAMGCIFHQIVQQRQQQQIQP